jgi:hypothetical protein
MEGSGDKTNVLCCFLCLDVCTLLGLRSLLVTVIEASSELPPLPPLDKDGSGSGNTRTGWGIVMQRMITRGRSDPGESNPPRSQAAGHAGGSGVRGR